MFRFEIEYGIMIEFIINMLRTVLMKQAVELFLTKKDVDEKLYQLVYGCFYLETSAAYCIWKVSFFYAACNFIGLAGIACCYDDTWKKRIWAAAALFCMDLSCLSAAVFLMGGSLFGEGFYLKTAAGVLLFLISVTAVSHIFSPQDFRQAVFEKKQMLLLSVTPAASILAIFSIVYTKPEHYYQAGIVCICMLVVNLSIFYLYHEMEKSYTHLRERDIYKQQAALYQNQMEIIMESGSRIRALRHDMKNHILALQALAGNGSREEMQAYLHKMQEFMVNSDEYVMTGNENIDSLLNYKIRRAEELLKEVETKISIPEKLSFASFELNIILGNLLDNAVEAAALTEEKKLNIQMRIEKGILFLNIGNSCNEQLSGKKGIGATTKADKRHHGIGMKNVQAALEKYHGDMDIVCRDGWFEADIMLYVKEL